MAEPIAEQIDVNAEIESLIRDTALEPMPERVENPRVVARVNTWQSRQRDALREEQRQNDIREWQLRNQASMQERQFRLEGLNALNRISQQQTEAQHQELLRENSIRAQAESADMMQQLPSIDVRDPEYRRKVAELQAKYPYGAATPGMRGIIDSYDADRRAFVSADIKSKGGEAAVQRMLRRNGATEEELRSLYNPVDGTFDVDAADSLLYEVNQRNATAKRDEARSYSAQTGVNKIYNTARAKAVTARNEVEALQREIAGMRRGDARLAGLQNRLVTASATLAAQDEIVNGLLADDPSLSDTPQAQPTTQQDSASAADIYSESVQRNAAAPAQSDAPDSAPVQNNTLPSPENVPQTQPAATTPTIPEGAQVLDVQDSPSRIYGILENPEFADSAYVSYNGRTVTVGALRRAQGYNSVPVARPSKAELSVNDPFEAAAAQRRLEQSESAQKKATENRANTERALSKSEQERVERDAKQLEKAQWIEGALDTLGGSGVDLNNKSAVRLWLESYGIPRDTLGQRQMYDPYVSFRRDLLDSVRSYDRKTFAQELAEYRRTLKDALAKARENSEDS